jgi:hypothetical protein
MEILVSIITGRGGKGGHGIFIAPHKTNIHICWKVIEHEILY